MPGLQNLALADESKTKIVPQEKVVVADPETVEENPVTYSVRIYKEPDRIKLKGRISSEEDYRTLIGLVKAHFPAIYLSDRVKIKEAPTSSDVKIGGLSFALKLLGYVENGHAAFDNNGLYLEGAADTAIVLERVQEIVDSQKPEGVLVKGIKVSAPEISWSIKLDENKTISTSGVIETSEKRENIYNKIRALFPSHTIIDRTRTLQKVPSHWDQSINKSIELLAFLEIGLVDVTTEAINLKGHAGSEGKLDLMVKATEDLPSAVSVISEVTAPEKNPNPRTIDSANDYTSSSLIPAN